MDETTRRRRWVVPVAGVVLVAVLVVVGLLRGAVDYDPSTPEGTVQAYIEAIVAGDYETAAGFWHEEGCIPDSPVPPRDYDVSVSLVDVETGQDEATVEVLISETTTDPFGNLVEYHEWFNLVRSGDRWLIRQPSWPYYERPCEAVG